VRWRAPLRRRKTELAGRVVVVTPPIFPLGEAWIHQWRRRNAERSTPRLG
jgi:hypothetical protein